MAVDHEMQVRVLSGRSLELAIAQLVEHGTVAVNRIPRVAGSIPAREILPNTY